MIVDMPVAILKVTWSDTPWLNNRPLGIPYDDNLINHLYLPLERGWGVSGFWREATFGLLNLEKSEVFPWLKLEGFNSPMPGQGKDRRDVINKAVEQGKAKGWPLDKFKAIVVLVGPRNINADAGGAGNRCLVQIGDPHDFCAHEFGHAIGFEHTLGRHPKTGNFESYIDQYCVMGEGSYAGPASAPAGAPPITDGYWGGMAPLPSAAELIAFLTGFTSDTNHVVHAGPLSPEFQRSLRIRARDLRRRASTPFPLSVVVDVAGGGNGTVLGKGPPAAPVAWTVELRRGAGWDNGIGRSGAPAAGLVVHSLRPIDEFDDGDPDFRPRSVIEGVLPLNPTNSIRQPSGFLPSADADARFGGGVFSVRVEEVADDLSWAEITVGGSLLGRTSAVIGEFGVLDGLASEAFEEGLAEDVPVFICGNNDYRYTLQRRAERRVSEVTAYGFDTPTFTWKVNGMPIPTDNSPSYVLKPSVTVAVVGTYPDPNGGSSTKSRMARVEYQQSGNVLTLIGDPEDGNYKLDVEVTATEGASNAANPAAPASAHRTIEMNGIEITYEPKYYEDLARCIDNVKSIDERYSKSIKPGPHPTWSMADSWNSKINALQYAANALDEAGQGVLSAQFQETTKALKIGALKMQLPG